MDSPYQQHSSFSSGARRKHARPQHQQQQQMQQQMQQMQQMRMQQQMQQMQQIPPPPAMSPLSPASPFTVAFMMADSIHSKVKTMLHKTRLQRKTEHIQFLRQEELLTHGFLGAGAFSQVTCVTNLRDRKKYACKHLQPKLLQNAKGFLTAATELAYEVHLLSSFQHPHIVRVHGWAANGIASFEQGQHDSFFLLLDLLEETLDQRIDQWKITLPGKLPDMQMRKIQKLQVMYQIANALEYIHSMGVLFRDLKPQNIGFLNGQVKLFDFGLSRELPALCTKQRFQMSGKVGTIRYMAPEVFLYQPYNIHCDIYSWSMVAYEILSQTRPFENFTPGLYQALVCQQGLRPCDDEARRHQPHSNFAQAIPTELRMLLERAWAAVPEQRLSLQEIQHHLTKLQQQARGVLLEHEVRLKQMHSSNGAGMTVSTSNSWMQTQQQAVPAPPPPPPPPIPAVTPPEQANESNHGDGASSNTIMSTSNDGSVSISMMMSNMMSTRSDSLGSMPPPPPPSSHPPPPAQVIDLSSDDSFEHLELDNDDVEGFAPLRDGSSNGGFVGDSASFSGFNGSAQIRYNANIAVGISAETPTMMRRKKRPVKYRVQHPQSRGRSTSSERWQNIEPLLVSGGKRSSSPQRGIRRRHSSDDIDEYMASLKEHQDFTMDLKGSSHHKKNDELPKRRRSADEFTMNSLISLNASRLASGSMTPPPLRGKTSSLFKIRQQQRQQKLKQQQQQRAIAGNNSSSSILHFSPATSTSKHIGNNASGKRSAWPLTASSAVSVSTATTTDMIGSSASLSDTWSEDTNVVFEQWASGASGNSSFS